MLLMQGNTYNLPITLKLDKEALNSENVKVVEVTFDTGGHIVRKTYPDEMTFENGVFVMPLSQSDTLALQGKCRYQVRVLFHDGSVKSSEIEFGTVKNCISKVVLA